MGIISKGCGSDCSRTDKGPDLRLGPTIRDHEWSVCQKQLCQNTSNSASDLKRQTFVPTCEAKEQAFLVVDGVRWSASRPPGSARGRVVLPVSRGRRTCASLPEHEQETPRQRSTCDDGTPFAMSDSRFTAASHELCMESLRHKSSSFPCLCCNEMHKRVLPLVDSRTELYGAKGWAQRSPGIGSLGCAVLLQVGLRKEARTQLQLFPCLLEMQMQPVQVQSRVHFAF